MNISTLLNFNCVHMSKYFKTILAPFALVLVCASSGYAQPIVITETVNDATTNGGTDGSITLVVTGGVGPYTYAWDHGPTTKDVSGLAAGNYGVTVTDANSTTADEDYVVGEPAAIGIGVNTSSYAGGNEISAPNATDGWIDITVTGGTQPYTYLWDHGPTTEDVSGLGKGVYGVTVTDAVSASAYESVELNEPSAISVVETIQEESGPGMLDGQIDLFVSGGVAPYTYAWDHGPTTSNISGLMAGTYSVTVTDANSESVYQSYTVTQAVVGLSVSETIKEESGPAMMDGEINLTVSGGTAPYTFAWDHGPTTSIITGLMAGTYSVTVTDAMSESVYQSYTVTQAVVGLSVSESIIDESGPAMMDGEINLTVYGGTAPYTFAWDHGPTTANISGLSAGTYGVTVTDFASESVYHSYTVSQSTPGLNVSANVTNATGPAALDGAIDLTVSGGSAPYTFAWDHGPTDQNLSGLSVGMYSVTVTDMMSESFYETYSVEDASATSLTISETITPESGPDMLDGQIDLTVFGGTPPYNYVWDHGPTTATVTGLMAGTYGVTVTDMMSVSEYKDFTVSQSSSGLMITETITEESGPANADGAISLMVSGGTAPYTFVWDHGPTTSSISGLTAGTYGVTVTDMMSESTYQSFYVGQAGGLDIMEFITNESGPAMMDGSISLSVSGGSAPYTYSWDHGPTTRDVTGLMAGTYGVTVTDAMSLTDYRSYDVGQSGTTFMVMEMISSESGPAMMDGSISLSVSGGSAPYTFAWDHGPTTSEVTGLMSGTYGVTITDMMSYSEYKSYFVPLYQDDQGISVMETINPESGPAMMDGSISLMVSGGSAPYTFVWDHGPTTQDVSGLGSGSYGVTITDMNSNSQHFGYFVPQSGPLNISLSSYYSTCMGNGRISVNVSGGVPPYNVTAQNPGGDTEFFWTEGSGWVTDIYGTGQYVVTVTDMDGTQLIETIDVADPPELSVSLTSPLSYGDYNASCSGTEGVIDIAITGGVAPFTIYITGQSEREDAETTAAAALVHSEPMSFTTSENTFQVTGLIADRYFVNVNDITGCRGEMQMQEIELTKPAIDLEVTPTVYPNGYYFSCPDCEDGEFNLTLSGGTEPYTYYWAELPPEVADMDMRFEGASLFNYADDIDGIDVTSPEAQQMLLSTEATLTNGKPETAYGIYVADQDGCASAMMFYLERPKPTTYDPPLSCDDETNPIRGQWIKDTTKVHVCPDVQVGIGTDVIPEGYALGVAGKIMAEEVEVRLAVNWPDYVFEDDYHKASLDDVSAFIKENGHLPDVPSAEEIERNGVSLGEMDAILLRKIEELTLYLIELKGENEELRKTIEELNR